jgi:hypothetical protein
VRVASAGSPISSCAAGGTTGARSGAAVKAGRAKAGATDCPRNCCASPLGATTGADGEGAAAPVSAEAGAPAGEDAIDGGGTAAAGSRRTQNTASQAEHRARTPPGGTFAGSTR